MSINEIPEDLFYYFPLILGLTCRRFHNKINIYTRNVIIIGDPKEKNIDYAKLKKVDITRLKLYERVILLGKIKPEIITLKNTNDLKYLSLRNLKNLCIEKFKHCDTLVAEKLRKKINISIKNLQILEEYVKDIPSLQKYSVERMIFMTIDTIDEDKELLTIPCDKYFRIDSYYPRDMDYYINLVINKKQDIKMYIKNCSRLNLYVDIIDKCRRKSILDIDKFMKKLRSCHLESIYGFVQPNFTLLDNLINLGIIEVIGELNNLKYFYKIVQLRDRTLFRKEFKLPKKLTL